MVDTLQVVGEKKRLAYQDALVKALEFELEGAVAHAGAILTGFSVKMGDDEVLVTLRAVLAGRAQIAFIGAGSLPDALLKVVREAMVDKLQWRDDKYVRNGS